MDMDPNVMAIHPIVVAIFRKKNKNVNLMRKKSGDHHGH